MVMDPLEAADPATDTSVALMSAALERGHRVRWCRSGDLWLDGGHVGASSQPAGRDGSGRVVSTGPAAPVPLAGHDVVLVRPDPPVDAAYLAMTLLLEQARGDTVIVNDPRALREANEKLYATRFPGLMPAHLVTADPDRLTAFAGAVGEAVIKPLDGHGGRDVVRVVAGAPGTAALLGRLTHGGRVPVMAQEFLPAVAEGDRRILLLEGAPLGVVRRVPAPGEFRANLGLGGRAERCELDDADRRIIAALAPTLVADGLALVGIDVVGGRLTEVNVTSPTGLCQLAALTGTRPDLEVVDWLERAAGR